MTAALNRWLRGLLDLLLLLQEHKVRSGLTILGISVGIWALVTLLAVGMGAREYIQGQVGKLGTDLLIVTPGNANDVSSYLNRGVLESLTLADVRALETQIPELALAAPVVQARGELSFRDRRAAGTVVGATPAYFAARDAVPALGRVLTPADAQAQAPVAVLGEEMARRLFSNRNPLGESIRFKGSVLEVVGVLRGKGDSSLGQGRDSEVIVPLSTMQHRIAGVRHVQMIFLKPVSEAVKERVRLQAELVLLTQHTALAQNGLPYTVTDLGQLAAIAGNLVGAMTALLVSIAGVSLVVGGIGVMNVMLASVSERIGEVGIRRAVGATQQHIRSQFLLEAGALTVLGGLVGIVLAALTVALLSGLLPWNAVIDIPAILAVLVASGAIGVFFGYYPARKAAKLTPMEALRYE
ncbi:ABC transporter permease [Thioalbus denitrificans]|uniref:Putative ABC transport system permease protein n=1 Tax=Thioalbus denitrificans TaxID=547122 RepID=A0A369CLE3_9GAMM|nr:ABC transporter permease [Thioalbus denitrificans]RCX33506.1 putative ABC transport system permease protein [Thioalbus denitrificans]